MIKLNDLAIGYNGEAILEHIDQEFDDGLIYGILAKSGAGKTTLLKTIAGLLRPVHGEVIIDGTTYRNVDKNPVYMMHQRYSNFGWLSCMSSRNTYLWMNRYPLWTTRPVAKCSV